MVVIGCGASDDEGAPEDLIQGDDATLMNTPSDDLASSDEGADSNEVEANSVGQNTEASAGDDATGDVFGPCAFYVCPLGYCQVVDGAPKCIGGIGF
jgi:hypothetical protein